MPDAVEISDALFHLTTQQIEWLVKRFTGGDSDSSTCTIVGVSESTLYRWKKADWFPRAYTIFAETGPTIFKPLVQAIFDSTAAVAAIEQRKLIETDNKDLDSRGVAAKATAIGDVLDRAIPRRSITEFIKVLRLEDLRDGQVITNAEVRILPEELPSGEPSK